MPGLDWTGLASEGFATAVSFNIKMGPAAFEVPRLYTRHTGLLQAACGTKDSRKHTVDSIGQTKVLAGFLTDKTVSACHASWHKPLHSQLFAPHIQ